MAKKEKPIQHPEYVKTPMDRRQFFARIAAASGIAGAAGYAAWAPETWPGSLKDKIEPGISSLISQKPKPFRLKDYRVERDPLYTADIGIARADRQLDPETKKPLEFKPEELRKMLHAAIEQIHPKGIEHFIAK